MTGCPENTSLLNNTTNFIFYEKIRSRTKTLGHVMITKNLELITRGKILQSEDKQGEVSAFYNPNA